MNRDLPPRWMQLAFTFWFVIWAPIILLTYGAQNFFWLCNVAQFIVLYALWRPNALLVSSQAGTVVLVGVVWAVDFAIGLAASGSVIGMTAYMFDPDIALVARLASLYHLWLPLLVLWLCWYNGYDDRGVWLQCLIGTLAILGAWLWSEPVRNINFAFAPFDIEPVWLPHGLYLVGLSIATALVIYFPGHYLVRFILRRLPRRHGPKRC